MTEQEKTEAAARTDRHDHPALCGPECEGLFPIGATVDHYGRRYRVVAHVWGFAQQLSEELSTVRPR